MGKILLAVEIWSKFSGFMPDMKWKQKGAVYFDAKLYINAVQIMSLQNITLSTHKYLHDEQAI